MKEVLLLGGGTHACCLYQLFCTDFNFVGYLSPEKSKEIELPYRGTDEQLGSLLEYHPEWFVVLGVGSVGQTTIRRKVHGYAQILQPNWLPLVHDTAEIYADTLPVGLQAFPRSVVNPGTTIGHNVILNTACVVEHNCILGDFVHIGPGAILTGAVQIGRGTHVGAGAMVRQGVCIGENCVVGMGAVVLRDIPAGMTVVGNPAREI